MNTTSRITTAFICIAMGIGGSANALERVGERAEHLRNFEIYDPNMFDRSTNIDNKWLPMKPGMRLVYVGTTVEDDGKVVPHSIEIYVTDLTKIINGIRTLISFDLDYSDGELEEAELAFYAQDNDGNVWRFGEYPEEYDDEIVVAAPAWIDGIDGARAGIMMRAEPRLGAPSYAQGWGPAVDWTDRAKVYQTGLKITVAAGSYNDVLVIGESSQSEPGALQLKYYAKGVGNVRVGWTGSGEKTKETLELVKYELLGPSKLAQVRAKALKLEQSAYQHSKNVYARTAASTVAPIELVANIRSGFVRASRFDQPKATGAGGSSKTVRMAIAKISDEKLKDIAVAVVPGTAINVAIEKKLGANRYVVEILSDKDGAEIDVIIDMTTHKVIAIDQ